MKRIDLQTSSNCELPEKDELAHHTPGCRGVWGRMGGLVSSASSPSPWATELLVSLRPALHHLTRSLVSQLRKGAKRKEGRMIAP